MERGLREILRKVRKRIGLKLSNEIFIRHIDEVDIIPNLTCNLNCVMCHQGQIKNRKDMAFETFRKVVGNLQQNGVSKVSLVGGEILVLKEIWKFVGFLEKVGMRYDLATNAVALKDEDIARLKNAKYLEKVSISIDGKEKTHNKIRRNPKAYQLTVKNFKKLLTAGIRVNVGCVVQKANIDELEEIIEHICKLGARDISLLVEIRVEDKEKEISKNIIKNFTGKDSEILISSMKNPLGEMTKEDEKNLSEKRDRIIKICEKYKAKLSFPIQMKDPRILDKKTPLKNFSCAIFSGYNFSIYNDAELAFCPFVIINGDHDTSKTNVRKIVNCDEYVKMRKGFKKCGAMPICRRCCALTLKK